MGGTGLKGGVGVGNGASSVVVEVGLDVTRDDTAEGTDELVDLARIGTADSVSDTDTVDTNLVDSAVDREKVDQLGTERVFRRKTDLNALGLDKLDNLDSAVDQSTVDVTDTLDSRLGDPGHVLAVRVLTEERRSTNDDVDTVDTSLDSDTGVVHVASDVGKNLGLLEAELADSLAVCTRLGRSGRRGKLDVLDTKLVKPDISPGRSLFL